MDDAPAASTPRAAEPLDLVNVDPRDLMRTLLPEARAMYIKAWEILADTGTPLERRRNVRERVAAIASDHAEVAAFLRERESSLTGDKLLNMRHLVGELGRHVEALNRMATISPLGLVESQSLRPESLGCGKRYRDPARTASDAGSSSRNVRSQPPSKPRESRDQKRGGDRPFNDRGPKVPRDALGTSKHDSTLGDDLDEATRAKLEAMRQALE